MKIFERHISVGALLDSTGAWDFNEQAQTGDSRYAMNVHGIIVQSPISSALTASVRGWLKGEGPNDIDDYVLICGQTQNLAFAHIVKDGTTAVNIKILGA